MAASSPFSERQLQPPSLLDKLLRRPRRENAVADLNNRLADGVTRVTPEDVREIEQRWQVDFSEEFRDDLEQLYARFARHCYRQRATPTPQHREEMRHLASLLRLDESAVERIERPMREKIYRATVRERIKDRRLEPEEIGDLEELGAKLDLDPATTHRIRQEEGDQVVRDYLNQSVEDGKLSPDEVAEVERAIESLGIEFTLTPEQQARWDRFRLYWQLEEGELPVVPVEINLQRNEVCHFWVDAEWYEQRTRTRSVRYSGPVARVRIAKGLYWRIGSADVQRVTEQSYERVDTVRVFLTNKRVLLVGTGRTTQIRLNRILDFEPYTGGVEIVKDAGRNPILLFEQDADLFCLTLDRLLREG